MTRRAASFMAANEASPVTYCSADGNRVTFRLENGKTFRLNAAEARETKPLWAWGK